MRQGVSNIRIREPEHKDAEYILNRENDVEALQVSNHDGGFQLSDIKQFIEARHTLKEHGQQRWLIDTDEHGPIGMIDLFDFNAAQASAGVGIWIDAKHRAKGVGAQAIQMLISLPSIKNDVESILAQIQHDNRISITFFEQIGFVHIQTDADILTYRFAI